MFYVYVLQSRRNKVFYKGYSHNLKKRLNEHNRGMVESTKGDLPWDLIYYESFLNQKDATNREKYLKTQWGRNFIRKVLANYFVEVKDDSFTI